MADEEVLQYCAIRKTDESPILCWMAYRREQEGGYAGTAVVMERHAVFTASSEARLQEIAKELGYSIQRATDG
jgi:hypothetical protein